jgi:hypothetical protein
LDEFAEPYAVPLAEPVERTELTELAEPAELSEPSTTETIPPASIFAEDQRLSALKRHLEECSLPAAKRRAGRQRISKALDHRKFFPKHFQKKTLVEQAKSKLQNLIVCTEPQIYYVFFCDCDMASRRENS